MSRLTDDERHTGNHPIQDSNHMRDTRIDMTRQSEDEAEVQTERLRDLDAQQLAEPMKLQAKKASERAKKRVTAEDILAAREQRAQEKRLELQTPEGRQKLQQRGERRASRARTGTGIVLLIAAGICVAVAGGLTAQAATTQKANAGQIQELHDHIDYLRSTVAGSAAEGTSAVSVVKEELSAIKTTASTVADLQNQFAALLAAHSEDPGNGAPSQGFLDAVGHRQALSPYFAEGTYLLDDDMLNSPTSNLGLSTDQIDPRLQWYERGLSYGSYSWSVVSATSNASGSPSLADATWLCQDDKTGDLLAWATGSWSTTTKSFVTLTVGTTSLGDQQNALSPAAASSAATSAQNGQ